MAVTRFAVLAVAALAACEPSPPARPTATPPPAGTASASGTARGSASSSEVATAPSGATPRATTGAPLPPPLAYGGAGAAIGPRGMVASESDEATRAGVEVLAAGGNAVDAAIAVAYALSVTHHAAGSLGGGGFMIVHGPDDGTRVAIDYREAAPAAATPERNAEQLAAGAHGYLSAAVPGVVAGLELARERYGTLPRETLVAPALRLARDGHAYGARPAQVLAWFWDKLKDRTLRQTLGRRGRPLTRGARLRQPELAQTLAAIAARGRAGFYEGEVATAIEAAMRRGGGLVTADDLRGYEAKVRPPLTFDYRGFEVMTMPPPSMGGVALYAITQHLAAHPTTPPAASAAGHHLFIEAARRAYADRRSIGADPDDPASAATLASRRAQLFNPAYFSVYEPPIEVGAATPSSALVPLAKRDPAPRESEDTTHFSVIDGAGMAVSCTTTTSAAFGAWVMVPGTGVILSNVMGAFSPQGVNALAPGKRPASSMSPTVITRGGRAVAAIGSPGGDTIPNSVAQVLRQLIDGGMTIDAAIEAPRIHHQYQPDRIRAEAKRALPASVLATLRKWGHTVQPSPLGLGDVNGITFDPETGLAYGFADTRKGGLAFGPEPSPGLSPADDGAPAPSKPTPPSPRPPVP
ncbi:MAG: gamma-glutamyltransferase [Myxococcota bacterium]